ncbi:MAG: hypothetical protein V4439_03510 [Patescibacteria group bacterium]
MLKVGVLRGGNIDDYSSSLERGSLFMSLILDSLSSKFKPIDILVDREGVWHLGGVPIIPADLINKVDVVWNTSHPSFSQVLENLSIPNIGMNSFSSGISESKEMLSRHVKIIGVQMPRRIILPSYQEDMDGSREKYAERKARDVFEKFSSPWIVRTLTKDLNAGIHNANTFPELIRAIYDLSNHDKGILVEELIPGKIISTHSVAGFRGEDIYTFPVNGISANEKEKLISITKNLYDTMGVTNYIKVDFVVNPGKGIYFMDVSFLPELNKDSNFCESCMSVGAGVHHIIDHMLTSAL